MCTTWHANRSSTLSCNFMSTSVYVDRILLKWYHDIGNIVKLFKVFKVSKPESLYFIVFPFVYPLKISSCWHLLCLSTSCKQQFRLLTNFWGWRQVNQNKQWHLISNQDLQYSVKVSRVAEVEHLLLGDSAQCPTKLLVDTLSKLLTAAGVEDSFSVSS